MSSLSVSERIADFRQSEVLQERFARGLRKATIEQILWPHLKPALFGRSFLVSYRKRLMPYPLVHPLDRLHYVEKYLEERSLGPDGLHPVVVFYYLKLFLQEYEAKAASSRVHPHAKAGSKKNSRSTAKKTSASKKKRPAKRGRPLRTEPEAAEVVRAASRILRKLEVPLSLKRARDLASLNRAVLGELQALAESYLHLEAENQSLAIEAELYRQSRQQQADEESRITRLERENQRLETELRAQQGRVHELEQERLHLAERLMGSTPDETTLLNELNLLRHEYNLISQKYDALVSKNIELSNRLSSMGPAAALEDVLNSIRDRVNRVLRSALAQSDDLLIAGLQSEIDQLKRARVYLGRALYDIGMLYLRSGRQGQALRELRAARELGVESHETNLILGRPA